MPPGPRIQITLRHSHPEISDEWHPSRNDPLTPDDVSPGSSRLITWQCDHSHEWEEKISNRVRGCGCPYCSGRRPTMETSLAALLPHIAAEWHPCKNGSKQAEDFRPGSDFKAHWLCPAGHEFQSMIRNRTKGTARCSYCPRIPKPGTSLAANYPETATLWHPTRNSYLTAEDVSAQAKFNAWWQCEQEGHEWQLPVQQQIKRKEQCLYCSNALVADNNRLSKHFPDIAQEWHPTKNYPLTPFDVTYSSTANMYWLCECGYEWQSLICSRVRGSRCHACSGWSMKTGILLKDVEPELLKQWHPTKNQDLDPNKILAFSGTKVWWKCDKANTHEWQVAPGRRMITPGRNSPSGCPYCAGKRVAPEKSFAVQFPALAEQWHPTKNGKLLPTDLLPHSRKMIWWKCDAADDHEWQALINSRTPPRVNGCPCCAGQKRAKSNSLITLMPDLAKEWHPTKNMPYSPEMVGLTLVGHQTWWQCQSNTRHIWRENLSDRTYSRKRASRDDRTQCPLCSLENGWNKRRLRAWISSYAAELKKLEYIGLQQRLLAEGILAAKGHCRFLGEQLLQGIISIEDLVEFAEGDERKIHKTLDNYSRFKYQQRSYMTSEFRQKIFDRDNNTCQNIYCCSAKPGDLTIDHKIAVTQIHLFEDPTWIDEEENLQTLCRSCNASKGAQTWETFQQRQKEKVNLG